MSVRPKRVLHVLAAMDRGGVENWLMDVLRRMDPGRVRTDFLVHTNRLCVFDREIEDRGCAILRCATSWRSPSYGSEITNLLRDSGPYDVVHSHVHLFSGYVLRLAHRLGSPLRVAHSHTDTSGQYRHASWLRRGYRQLARHWLWSHATHMVAASKLAGRALFGRRWESDQRGRLLHCGIDLTPFQSGASREGVRREFDIPVDAFVIGHVGRFDTPKNHLFLVDIAAEATRLRPTTRVLMVGDGPARRPVEERLRALGISRLAVLTGDRPDVPRLLNAMDVFVFPSIREGLPLTVLEAQAAGLPGLISDGISEETDIVPGLIHRAPLSQGARRWAELALGLEQARSAAGPQALAAIAGSDFNILRSVEQLYALYNA